MALTGIHAGDYGWALQLTIVQDGVAQDISAYTTRVFILTAPDGTQATVTAIFDSDGTDGVLTYAVADGDIDQIGVWYVQARVSKAGAELTSEAVAFVAAARDA